MAKDDVGSHAASVRDDAAGPRPLAALAALGVVFGDLGTSPLYTLQTVVEAAGGHFTPRSALGILSLIFWTLIVTVSVKYCLFVMRADNRGEGGILALMSLVGANALQGRTFVFTAMGLLGAGAHLRRRGDHPGHLRAQRSRRGECGHLEPEAVHHALGGRNPRRPLRRRRGSGRPGSASPSGRSCWSGSSSSPRSA